MDKIRQYLGDSKEKFVIIGGHALVHHLSFFGIRNIRATTDIDVVVKRNADADFYSQIINLCSDAVYQGKHKDIFTSKDGKRCFLKFSRPASSSDENFPEELEFFCYNLNEHEETLLEDTNCNHIKKIDFLDQESSSIAGILIDKELDDFFERNSQEVNGIFYINVIGLICLKIFAWSSNKKRKASGEDVKQVDINKHRDDVLMLLVILSPNDLEKFKGSEDYILFKIEISEFISDFRSELELKAPYVFSLN